jgi:hypothetical protein
MSLLFAQFSPAEKLQLPTTKTSPELFWVLVAIGAIVLVIIAWALFFRRRPDEVSGWGPARSHYHEPSADLGSKSSHGSRRRRRRRRRREHRPRNPTLAETGGLPPVRPEQSPDPES